MQSLSQMIPGLIVCSILFTGLQSQGEIPSSSAPVPRRESVSNLKKIIQQRARFITYPDVSFRYNGKQYAGLPDNWKKRSASHNLDANRIQHSITWTDPKTALAVRVVGIEYRDYPAVEWTVYFKNNGATNTPILEDIQAFDVVFERGPEREFVLSGLKGDSTTPDSYEPYQFTLGPNTVKNFAPLSNSGKSTAGPDGWPYYDLQIPGGAVLMAVGWPGQWAASFARDTGNGLRIKAGQQLTHLYLKPGEEIRTPLIVMLFWRDTNPVAAHNLWRRWFMAHNIPHFDGHPQAPVASLQITGAAQDTNLVNSYLQAGVKIDVCWRDAFNGGYTWYPSDTGPFKDKGNDIYGKLGWLNTGTWDIDTRVLPQQFKPFSKWIHAQGINFMLWFEPERVGDQQNSWLGKNHPEWLLAPTEATVGAILDEGNPAARDWLINHVDDLIKSQGLDWYREDMNGNGPLTAWRKHDAEDRQGITENLYVQGHLAFWDELKRRHPRLHIDSCASGGRRNDLETMRRAVPLARSDFVLPSAPAIIEGNQGHTYGLSFWLPWQGSQTWFTNAYACRSWYLPGFLMTRENDYLITQTELSPASAAFVKKTYAECAEIAPCLLGDYYPLTPYSRELDQWIAWQFNRPEQGRGVVQAFRREKCKAHELTVKLQGLEPRAVYTLKNFDAGTFTRTGAELMKTGLTISVSDSPGAAIITYTKNSRSAF